MNQTVVRIYLLMLVSVLGVVFAVWPNIGPRGLWTRAARFLVVVGVGVTWLLTAFHQAGQVNALGVDGAYLYVEEVFHGRMWSPVTLTRVRTSDGEVQAAIPTDMSEPESKVDGAERLRFVSQLSGRVERLQPETGGHSGVYVGVGPVLHQGRAALVTDEFIIVSAYEELGEPSLVYLVRINSDGQVQWRLKAEDIGLDEGQLQGAHQLNSDSIVVAMNGVKHGLTWFEQVTFSTHVVLAKIRLDDGQVLWLSAF